MSESMHPLIHNFTQAGSKSKKVTSQIMIFLLLAAVSYHVASTSAEGLPLNGIDNSEPIDNQ